MAKSLLIIIMLLAISGASQATTPSMAELRALFPQLDKTSALELYSNGSTHRYYYKGGSALFTPLLLPSEQHHAGLKGPSVNYNLNVEAIYYIPLQTKPQLLALYNTLRSVSTLTGVEYYSESRKKMRTLFKRVYAVDNKESRKKIADPLVTSIPSLSKVTVFQQDLTFGKNVSEAVYQFSGRKISLSLSNLTDIRYAFLPFIRKGNMHTNLILIPQEEGVLIYGNIRVKTLNLMGLEKKKRSSFYHRLDAMFRWFKANIMLYNSQKVAPMEIIDNLSTPPIS